MNNCIANENQSENSSNSIVIDFPSGYGQVNCEIGLRPELNLARNQSIPHRTKP
jgi:hypothetical protein